MSARTGASSKANSFQTIFGINSGPGDFLTFKARRVLYTVRSEISCDFLFVFYTDMLGSSQSNQLSMIIGLYEINYELNTDCL